VRFNSDWSGYCSDFGSIYSYDPEANGGPRDGMPCSGNVGLGPYAAIVLSQDD
jgi:1,4-alpha-glucan branching enzyme